MDHCKKEAREVNPRETANFCSLITFSYTIKLFRQVFGNKFEENDIYEVPKYTASKKCGDKMEKKWKKRISLFRLLWQRFGFTYVILGIINLTWTIINSVLQPYAMSQFISYFEANQKSISRNEAYYYAGIVVLLSIFHCFYLHNYFMFESKLAIKIRASLGALLYRKILKISPAAITPLTLGNTVTLMTKDLRILEHDMWLLNDFCISTIQFCTISYLMYSRMGKAALIGIGFLFVGLPIEIFLGTLVNKMRLKIGQMSDERLHVTQEALSAIRIIKMYTWESFFNKKISEARKKEITALMRVLYLNVIIICIGILSSSLAFPILIMSYIWMGNTPSTQLIFYILGLFRHLKHCIGISIPICLSMAASCYASVQRISSALDLEELENSISANRIGSKKLALTNVCVKIDKQVIIKDISFSISTPGLNVITGPVGSGKSSLLKTVLKQYPIDTGDIMVNGTVSYASQNPWVFPSSLKQNILFGQSFDRYRYHEVTSICALQYDFDLLEKCDETIVTDNGLNLSKGQQSRINLARAIYKDSDIYLLDDCLAALDARVQDQIFNECIKRYLKNKIVILVTQNPIHIKEADKVIIMINGHIKSVTEPSNIILNEFVKDREEIAESKIEGDGYTPQSHDRKNIYQETKNEDSVKFGIYMKYIKFGGGIWVFATILLILVASQFMESYSHKLISKWVDYQQTELTLLKNGTNTTDYKEAVSNKEYTFNLYISFIFMATALALIKTYALLRFCRRASLNIHQAMIQRVLNAVMEFFDNHFIGNILNRFSYDLDNTDERLSMIFRDFFRVLFSVGGIIILIATINWYFVIIIALFALVIVLIRTIYMPTGRALKRMEAITRSPLIGHINATLDGISTIRAFQAEDILKNEFDKHQDLYTSTEFMSITTMRAFGFFMDSLGTIFIIFIIIIFLFVATDTSVGNVGLALTQVFMLTGFLQWAVRQWAELENQMTSVERVLEYTEINQEDRCKGIVNNWPKDGEIKYDNVTLTYNTKVHVLKNIHFRVEPKQKIGIVGRTGAGKSSIISTLFGLYKFEGRILIDDIDIKSISLDYLRRNIAIIPQDPIIIADSVRNNMDPYKIYSDHQIWEAFEKVNLKELITDLGINIMDINLSSGQKQLITIARVILRNSKIVVLDEATANLDPEIELLIHRVIKDNFSECTVLTVAHRLNSVIECDKVMVLENGEIVDFDNPKVLLESKDSLFFKMIQQSQLVQEDSK